ncbi:MAG: hypothetical protein AAGH89_05830 [Verrucomicrobiota bacterium]
MGASSSLLAVEGEGVEGDRATFSGSSFAPEPVTEEDFSALKMNSPFLRPLDLSRSLILIGLAEVDGKPIATLRNLKTKETVVISGKSNPQGWQLVGVEGDQNSLETLSAQIAVQGGEVVSIRFDESQINPGRGSVLIGPKVPASEAKRIAAEARNFRRGISADGFSGAPPKELADKFGRLSEEQRGRLIYQMGQLRSKGVGSEERRKIFTGLVNRALPRTSQ